MNRENFDINLKTHLTGESDAVSDFSKFSLILVPSSSPAKPIYSIYVSEPKDP